MRLLFKCTYQINKMESKKPDYHLIRGIVNQLHLTESNHNALDAIQKKLLPIGTAIPTGTSEEKFESRMALVSMSDGEYFQSFGCYVGSQLVAGSLGRISFKNGDDVTVVANRLDEVTMQAHAVVRKSDGLLWLPMDIKNGRLKVAQMTLTLGLILLIFYAVIFFVIFLLMLGINLVSTDGQFKSQELWITALIFLASHPFMLGIIYWAYSAPAYYAESLFKILGFKQPWRVNIEPFYESGRNANNSDQGYNLYKALAVYDSLPKSVAKSAR